MKRIGLTLILLACAGCVTTLDHDLYDVHRDFCTAASRFADVVTVYDQAADGVARSHFTSERNRIDGEFKTFVSMHTVDGRLESRDATGKVQPMLAIDLLAAIDKRESLLAATGDNERRWSMVHVPMAQAIADLKSASAASGKTAGDIMRAKESAQQFVDSAVKIGGGFLGAMGFMAVAH